MRVTRYKRVSPADAKRTSELLARAWALDQEAKACLGSAGRRVLEGFKVKGKGGKRAKLDLQEMLAEAAQVAAEKAGEEEELRCVKETLEQARRLRWEVVVLWDHLADLAAKNQEELQEGRLGLWDTAKRFDPGRKLQFQTYANWWIRARITRYRDRDRGIEVGSHSLERLRNLSKAETLGFDSEKICEYLNLSSVEELHRLRGVMVALKAESLDALAEGDPERDGPGYEPADPNVVDPTDRVEEEGVLFALSFLGKREQKVLSMRYALNGQDEPASLSEIGDALNLSRERVRQLETKALRELRRTLWLPEPMRKIRGSRAGGRRQAASGKRAAGSGKRAAGSE